MRVHFGGVIYGYVSVAFVPVSYSVKVEKNSPIVTPCAAKKAVMECAEYL
jgi:hypothetical protein